MFMLKKILVKILQPTRWLHKVFNFTDGKSTIFPHYCFCEPLVI